MNKIYKKEKEELSIEDKISYELVLGFRKIDGINISEFKKKYNIDIESLYNIKDLIKDKKLIVKDEYIYINKDYLYVSNEILLNFV